uniref:Uncharacterized protein n=1 Tax=Hucho hucho TaxID=62062 RepID=A0A4W5MS83_9TELE
MSSQQQLSPHMTTAMPQCQNIIQVRRKQQGQVVWGQVLQLHFSTSSSHQQLQGVTTAQLLQCGNITEEQHQQVNTQTHRHTDWCTHIPNLQLEAQLLAVVAGGWQIQTVEALSPTQQQDSPQGSTIQTISSLQPAKKHKVDMPISVLPGQQVATVLATPRVRDSSRATCL